jgi:hypothetical protein
VAASGGCIGWRHRAAASGGRIGWRHRAAASGGCIGWRHWRRQGWRHRRRQRPARRIPSRLKPPAAPARRSTPLPPRSAP